MNGVLAMAWCTSTTAPSGDVPFLSCSSVVWRSLTPDCRDLDVLADTAICVATRQDRPPVYGVSPTLGHPTAGTEMGRVVADEQESDRPCGRDAGARLPDLLPATTPFVGWHAACERGAHHRHPRPAIVWHRTGSHTPPGAFGRQQWSRCHLSSRCSFDCGAGRLPRTVSNDVTARSRVRRCAARIGR
jgi:hypothetical protein